MGEKRMDCLSEYVKDGEMKVLKDKRTMFTNLRLMRDGKQKMFAALCPQAQKPHDKEFSKQFDLMQAALKCFDPKTFGDESKYFKEAKASKNSVSAKTTKKKKKIKNDSENEKIRDRKKRFQSKQRSASGSRKSR